MMRFSQRLLFVASILTFNFLSLTRGGQGWEVSPELVQFGNIVLLISMCFFLISIIFWVKSIDTFKKIASPYKILYYVWIIILAIIYIIGWSQDIYGIPLQSDLFNLVLGNALFAGIYISIILLIILEVGNKQAYENFSRLRISHVLLFCASILVSEFLWLATWNMKTIQAYANIVLLISTILFLISVILWALSIDNFREITLPFKIVYSIWISIIIVIYIFGWSQELYSLMNEESVFRILKFVFYEGLFISLVLLTILEIGNKQAINKRKISSNNKS